MGQFLILVGGGIACIADWNGDLPYSAFVPRVHILRSMTTRMGDMRQSKHGRIEEPRRCAHPGDLI